MKTITVQCSVTVGLILCCSVTVESPQHANILIIITDQQSILCYQYIANIEIEIDLDRLTIRLPHFGIKCMFSDKL